MPNYTLGWRESTLAAICHVRGNHLRVTSASIESCNDGRVFIGDPRRHGTQVVAALAAYYFHPQVPEMAYRSALSG